MPGLFYLLNFIATIEKERANRNNYESILCCMGDQNASISVYIVVHKWYNGKNALVCIFGVLQCCTANHTLYQPQTIFFFVYLIFQLVHSKESTKMNMCVWMYLCCVSHQKLETKKIFCQATFSFPVLSQHIGFYEELNIWDWGPPTIDLLDSIFQ